MHYLGYSSIFHNIFQLLYINFLFICARNILVALANFYVYNNLYMDNRGDFMEILKWLSITDRYTKIHLDRRLAPLGLNSSQHIYLLRICMEPGITQDRLFNLFYIHPSNITRSLAYLEKTDFLRKEPHKKDKRTCSLYPTEKALIANEQILSIIDDWYDSLLQNFSSEEKELLTSLLNRAGENAIDALSRETEFESN